MPESWLSLFADMGFGGEPVGFEVGGFDALHEEDLWGRAAGAALAHAGAVWSAGSGATGTALHVRAAGATASSRAGTTCGAGAHAGAVGSWAARAWAVGAWGTRAVIHGTTIWTVGTAGAAGARASRAI